MKRTAKSGLRCFATALAVLMAATPLPTRAGNPVEDAIIEAAAPLATCPMATAYLVVATPTGQITVGVCPTIFQFTPPIFYVGGSLLTAAPGFAPAMTWDEFTAAIADVPMSPALSAPAPPPCPATSLFTSGAGLNYELCVTGFAYTPPHFTIKAYVRGDAIFHNGFDGDTIFSNGFERTP